MESTSATGTVYVNVWLAFTYLLKFVIKSGLSHRNIMSYKSPIIVHSNLISDHARTEYTATAG